MESRYKSGGKAITAIKMRPTSELKRKRLSGAVGSNSQKRQLGVIRPTAGEDSKFVAYWLD